MASPPSLDDNPRRNRKLCYGDTITVLVGCDEQKFVVYSQILYTGSLFFKACLDGDFEETQKGMIRLPEDEPDLFEAIIDWIYGWSCFSHEHDSIDKLVRTYVLADKLIMPRCQNAIMDTIRRHYQKAPIEPEAIAFIETCQLDVHSPLVQFFTKYHAYCMVRCPRICLDLDTALTPIWNLEGVSLATAVITELLKYIANHSTDQGEPGSLFSGKINPALEEDCVYHVHDNEHEDCPKRREEEEEE